MTTSREAARQIVAAIVEAYNAKDPGALAALYHDDARYWSPLDDWQEGLPAIRSHIEQLHRDLPDEQMEVLTQMTDGDTIVAEFRSTGTSPSGASYAVEFTEVIELRNGKIDSVMVYLDPEEIEQVTA